MALFKLALYGNPILEKVCEKVGNHYFDTPEIHSFGASLIDTMIANRGIGLAAPQVGVGLQIFAMELPSKKDSQPLVMCNPTLREQSTLTSQHEEGCLSMPGIYLPIVRPDWAILQYRDLSGKSVELELSGLDARVAQHEFDHLRGILLLSQVSRQIRRAALRDFEKWQKKNANTERYLLSSDAMSPFIETLQSEGLMPQVLR